MHCQHLHSLLLALTLGQLALFVRGAPNYDLLVLRQ